jgi:hypothetical protein
MYALSSMQKIICHNFSSILHISLGRFWPFVGLPLCLWIHVLSESYFYTYCLPAVSLDLVDEFYIRWGRVLQTSLAVPGPSISLVGEPRSNRSKSWSGRPIWMEREVQSRIRVPHTFNVRNYTRPTMCQYCKKLLRGLFRQGMQCKGNIATVQKKCKHFFSVLRMYVRDVKYIL